MMKGIKISTKIILLMLMLSLIAVSAISFFTYDYVHKINREKYVANLTVIADNRAGYFNSFFDKAVQGIRVMQQSETLKGGGVSAVGTDPFAMGGPSIAPDSSAAAEPASDPIKDYLDAQKDNFG